MADTGGGQYECSASNVVGSNSNSTEVRVQRECVCVSVSSMDVKCLLLWARTAVSGFRCTCNHCVCMNVCCTQCASCESRVDAASLLVVSIFSLFNVCSLLLVLLLVDMLLHTVKFVHTYSACTRLMQG